MAAGSWKIAQVKREWSCQQFGATVGRYVDKFKDPLCTWLPLLLSGFPWQLCRYHHGNPQGGRRHHLLVLHRQPPSVQQLHDQLEVLLPAAQSAAGRTQKRKMPVDHLSRPPHSRRRAWPLSFPSRLQVVRDSYGHCRSIKDMGVLWVSFSQNFHFR